VEGGVKILKRADCAIRDDGHWFANSLNIRRIKAAQSALYRLTPKTTTPYDGLRTYRCEQLSNSMHANTCKRFIEISHDGEVVAAAHAIDKVIPGAGCDWHHLVKAVLPPATQSNGHSPDSERSIVQQCFYSVHLLSQSDAKFIQALMCRWMPLTDKQRAWRHDIVAKLERLEAA
jgi:hypothetical protein